MTTIPPAPIHPAADVWAAYFEENALPVCGEKAHYTYKHWGEDLPDTVALAANGMGINGHEAGTYLWSEVWPAGAMCVPAALVLAQGVLSAAHHVSTGIHMCTPTVPLPPPHPQVTFDRAYLKYKPDWDPETMSCARFMPYVDARNGMVYARSVTPAPGGGGGLGERGEM